MLEGARVVMVAAGRYHSAASTSEGEVMTWGCNWNGELGHGDQQNRTRPTKLGREVFGGSAVMMVSCGGFHTMAVTEVGRLFTFGWGICGELGHGDRNDRNVPVEVGGARFRGARIVFAAAGCWHSGVVTSEGGIWTWGEGINGRLGHNDQETQLVVPKEVEGELGGGSGRSQKHG